MIPALGPGDKRIGKLKPGDLLGAAQFFDFLAARDVAVAGLVGVE